MKWAPILAMVIIGALEAFALYRGINGTGLALAIAAVAGLGGYHLKGVLDRRRGGTQQ